MKCFKLVIKATWNCNQFNWDFYDISLRRSRNQNVHLTGVYIPNTFTPPLSAYTQQVGVTQVNAPYKYASFEALCWNSTAQNVLNTSSMYSESDVNVKICSVKDILKIGRPTRHPHRDFSVAYRTLSGKLYNRSTLHQKNQIFLVQDVFTLIFINVQLLYDLSQLLLVMFCVLQWTSISCNEKFWTVLQQPLQHIHIICKIFYLIVQDRNSNYQFKSSNYT